MSFKRPPTRYFFCISISCSHTSKPVLNRELRNKLVVTVAITTGENKEAESLTDQILTICEKRNGVTTFEKLMTLLPANVSL